LTDGLLEVGRIARAHGLRGEVVVDFLTDRPERTAAGAVLESDRGPFVVEAARPHGKRWIVAFAGIGRREEAEALAGTVLRAAPIDDPDELWAHQLVGSVVREADGTERGRVVALVDNPAHDLLELEDGALVPMVFVLSCEDGVTTIDPPEGLFD
jgi:16S rRNA processing protein RimM